MRISFVTPLFPPDVHAVALYHKALVGELAKTHSTTALVYGKYPESVDRVTFLTIDKQANKRARVFKMFTTLMASRRTTDVYVISNGPSTELPALIISYLTKKPIILLASDTVSYTGFNTFVHKKLLKRVATIIAIQSEVPQLIKPEIHPLLPYPTEAVLQYEQRWNEHVTNISQTLSHVTKQ